MYPLKRGVDLLFAIPLAAILFIPVLLLCIVVRTTGDGPIFYWSNRIGRDNKLFLMPKFRTMQLHTPTVATHLLKNPNLYLTPIGSVLRRTSLDEVPQLWSILKGDMSLVGPRPALFNQEDLISLRTERGIHRLLPGLTGWAQINGRDELAISEKVELDAQYLHRQSFLFDLKILWMTCLKVISKDGISH